MAQAIIPRRGGRNKFVYSENFTQLSKSTAIQLDPSKNYVVRAFGRKSDTGNLGMNSFSGYYEYSIVGGACAVTFDYHVSTVSSAGYWFEPTIDSSGVLKPFSIDTTADFASLCIVEI